MNLAGRVLKWFIPSISENIQKGWNMDKFLEAAAIAWNPIGESRRRMKSGTLTAGSVLVPFIGIVIACNLFALGAQKFFFQSVLYATGGKLPNDPLMTNDFAQRLMSALGVLVPAGAVSLLPTRIFNSSGRSATVASILVVAAGWAFYGAVLSIPLYFFPGALATVNPALGMNAYVLLIVPIGIGIIGLTLYFWFRIMLSVLKLNGPQVAIITLVALTAGAVLVGFFVFIGIASVSSTSLGQLG
jgi:hypothetical protein